MAPPVRIRWQSSLPISIVHAARVVATGRTCHDQSIEQAFVPSVTEINQRLLISSIDVRSFWDELIREMLARESLEQACEIALTAAGCSELHADQTAKGITRRLDECRVTVSERFPRLSEQLELRYRPLKDRWDSLGNGLLNLIARRIWGNSPPKNWWPPRIDAAMVQPVRGGDGGFDAPQSALWMEAMLTDADPQVPEVLRLAWLITRVAIEQHVAEKSGGFAAQRPSALLPAWTFASIALVLQSASELDLTDARNLPIATAMRLWRFSENPKASEILHTWWSGQQSSPTALPIALKSLAQRLESDPTLSAMRP